MLCRALFILTASFTRLGAAQTCGGAEPVSIESQDDADSYSNCDSFIGGIRVISVARGNITLPNVELIGGALRVPDTLLSSFSMPDLHNASDITISENANLSALDFAGLHAVYGDLSVTDNGELGGLSLPGLQIVSGIVNLTGAFTNISFGSELQQIEGGFTASSTENLDCGALDSLRKSGVFRGAYSCISNRSPSSASSSASASSSPSSSPTEPESDSSSSDSGLSSGAKIGLGVGVGVGIPALAGFIIGAFLLGRRQWKSSALKEEDKEEGKSDEESEESTRQGPFEVADTDRYTHEMGDDTAIIEMPSNKSAVVAELDSRNGVSELPGEEVSRTEGSGEGGGNIAQGAE
ncbi:hypothetical protein BJX99DRAFT_254102 [Aspergillus californicus]